MFFIHVVKPGDSLYSISQNYGVSFQRLQEINGVYPGGLVPAKI
ncbi:LysM peptidoglycan-binding domain-containing protein [Bacillus sp. FSL W8-0116]